MDSLLSPNPALKRLLEVIRENQELRQFTDLADTQRPTERNPERRRATPGRKAASSGRGPAGTGAAPAEGLAGDESPALPLVVDYASGWLRLSSAAGPTTRI